ncbi:MAG TPA: site-2 protease family protein [Thermomicrobiales bacterium]|nr:site-2 protease family protein [Thermomicrobiales bacterium]
MSRPIHFYVQGIPIRLGRLWLVVAVCLAVITANSFAPPAASTTDATLWYIATFAVALTCALSLLTHELAHVWVARRVGGRVIRIEPYMFGALTDDSYPPDSPRSEASVAAAGPLASLALGIALGVAWLLTRDAGRIVSLSVGFVALMNLTLGVANLLPAFPFDGGRLLRAFVWFLTGDLLTGTRVVSICGNFIALIGLVSGAVLLSHGNPLSVWGAWTVLAFWAVHREGREGYARAVWREASRTMTIDEAGLANSSRVAATRTIDDAIDDVLQGVVHGPLLVADPERRIIGIVSLAQVRKVPRGLWPERLIGDVAAPLDGMPRASDGESILDLLNRFDATGAELILIETRGQITGAVDLETTYAKVRARVREERIERRNRRK